MCHFLCSKCVTFTTVVCHQPVFFVSKPHPTLKHGYLGLENFDQNQNEGHICPLCPSKKKICQRPLPRPKKAIYLFSHPKARFGHGRSPGNLLVPRGMPVPAGPGKTPLVRLVRLGNLWGRRRVLQHACCFKLPTKKDSNVSL